MKMLNVIALVFSLSLAGVGFADSVVNMEFQKQQQDNWCWAAVTSMIYHENSPDGRYVWQCKMASRFIADKPGEYCCDAGVASTSTCNRGYRTKEALDHYGLLDGYSEGRVTDATMERIRREIGLNYPVALSTGWATGGGHAIVLYGFGFGGIAGGQAVYIYDPTTGRQVSWDDDINRYGSNGTLRGTFFTKKPGN